MFSVIISIFQAAGCVSNLWHQIVFKHFWGHRLVRWCENKQYFLTIHLNNLVSETLSGVKTIFLENYFDEEKIFFSSGKLWTETEARAIVPRPASLSCMSQKWSALVQFFLVFERKKKKNISVSCSLRINIFFVRGKKFGFVKQRVPGLACPPPCLRQGPGRNTFDVLYKM